MTASRVSLLPITLLTFAALLLGSCGRTPRPPEQVPSTYKDVQDSPGHTKHVGKVDCAACHGDDGFEPPPAEVCSTCHAAVMTPLHPGTRAPACQDCHRFGPPPDVEASAAPGATCLRCHDHDQSTKIHAIGAHADQPCTTCHQPHKTPTLSPPPCTKCHADQETKHAGARGCLDCHHAHEAARAADQGCLTCHSKQHRELKVDQHALTTGHTKCTGCHQPHKFGKAEVKPCATCHENKPMLVAAKHGRCATCHNQHDDAPKPCMSCHNKAITHPAGHDVTPLEGRSGACTGCHPAHLAALGNAKAVPCAACHQDKHHAKEACLSCHVPHAAKPVVASALCGKCHTPMAQSTAQTGHAACGLCHTAHGPKPPMSAALCATCHGNVVRTTAGTGHGACATCHVNAVHAPKTPPPACATCHQAQGATAPKGHQACISCHQQHDPKHAPPTCATCHADKAKVGHGTKLSCATCHVPHAGVRGPATPPTCESCHNRTKLPGLHRSAGHATCTTCHNPHEAQPRSDRASCLSCHKDRTNHEPTAPTCAGCHPFRDGGATYLKPGAPRPNVPAPTR